MADDIKGPTDLSLNDQIIFEMVKAGVKVLDLGCGNGEILYALEKFKNVRGQGIELSQEAIYQCVEKGLSVFHGDIDGGLSEYPDDAFDTIILNHTLQEVKQVDFVISEALRVGRTLIVAFPNFAYFEARWRLCFRGRAPVMSTMPHPWYDTPNVRFHSIRDFEEFCRLKGYRILAAHSTRQDKEVKFWPNLQADNAVYAITRPGTN
ncbi:MAG: methionine biosynthesis protein MetW [Elusimicrobia bacterium]|nr:methionine biosynthesis protein MetW [Candidatus Obscuribacterium magneticum]